MNLLKALRNTFLSKLYSFNLNKGYPLSIIPKKYFKIVVDIDELLQHYDLLIVRRSELPIGKSFIAEIKLRSDAIKIERIPFLSMNFLGGLFKPKHTSFRPGKTGSKSWNGERINVKEIKGDYSLNPDSDNLYSTVTSPIKLLELLLFDVVVVLVELLLATPKLPSITNRKPTNRTTKFALRCLMRSMYWFRILLLMQYK